MNLTDTITVRVNANDRQIIAALARSMERSEGDTVRQIVRQKAAELGIAPSAANEARRPANAQT